MEKVIVKALSLWPDQGNLRLLISSPVLGLYALPTVSTVRIVFKDAALRDQSVVEINCTLCAAEPLNSL